jgi:hypothetical protein
MRHLPGHERGCTMRESRRDSRGRFVAGPVPSCGGTFVCEDCGRTVGWCQGTDEDERCVQCWLKTQKKEPKP